MTGGWQPTMALLRAALVSALLAVVAVLVGRIDLLVLATPLVVHAVAAVVRRPSTPPATGSSLGLTALREGEGTQVRVRLTDAAEVEHAVVQLNRHRWTALRPANGVVGCTPARRQPTLELCVAVASLRWGRRPVGDGLVGGVSSWAGYQWGPVRLPTRTVTTLPLPGRFDSRAPAPHPIGLVGTNPARRPGEGSEFASIRPWHPGDRLRRVQWRVSLRTRELHVTSTVAEEDASVLLLVDSGTEVGVSEGVHGAASTLDTAVRAAGAVAEHYLTRGDRVGLRVLGATRRNAVSTSSGRRHLRVVLDTLASVVPGESRHVDPGRLRFRISAGTVVIVLSPLLSDTAVATTTTLAARGLDVVVVDTLPEDLRVGDDPRLLLAWRMRTLERDEVVTRVRRAGIPVVPWRGPGTLDQILVRLARRRAAPVGVRR
ncbi:MAG: DUF58 domain-containing protein [Nocardioidaceae bacterium]|nr:DUF58 domain-containing protein [Nocardioidaceae bacterium]NUS52854.1 DUF58 domain-containing protein [Nocardioidaceae bacterium]